MAEHYSGKKAAEIVGITYRQLDYWARTDLVRPSVADASESTMAKSSASSSSSRLSDMA